jgi:hypothetical protein
MTDSAKGLQEWQAAHEVPQWQAAYDELLRDRREGETATERFISHAQAAIRMEAIGRAFLTGTCPTCGGKPDWPA